MRWDDAAFWPSKFKLEGREFTYPEAGKAFRINPGVLLHRVTIGMSPVDALMFPIDLFMREIGYSLGFLRVINLTPTQVTIQCSRCLRTSEVNRENLQKGQATSTKRSGCAHCYKSKVLFRDGDRFLTALDAQKEIHLSYAGLRDRLRRAGIDVKLWSVVDLAAVRAVGRSDGVVLARRKYRIGDRIGLYTVQGYVRRGYVVVCDRGHTKQMDTDMAERAKSCGTCSGRGQHGQEMVVGGRRMSAEALARVAGLSVQTVRLRLRKGSSPEDILFARRR